MQLLHYNLLCFMAFLRKDSDHNHDNDYFNNKATNTKWELFEFYLFHSGRVIYYWIKLVPNS